MNKTVIIYEYKNCGTCKKALKYLDHKKIAYQKFAIRETPPKLAELKQMLQYVAGDIRKLFNTSGLDYKNLKLKDKIPKMSEAELLAMLSKNGNLIKRPFVLLKDHGFVGFKEAEWENYF